MSTRSPRLDADRQPDEPPLWQRVAKNMEARSASHAVGSRVRARAKQPDFGVGTVIATRTYCDGIQVVRIRRPDGAEFETTADAVVVAPSGRRRARK